MKTKTKKAKKTNGHPGGLGGLFGFAVTAVCRALGKHGLNAADVRGILHAKKIKIADGTVSIQTSAGKLKPTDKNYRGEPAPLTPEQVRELKALAAAPPVK